MRASVGSARLGRQRSIREAGVGRWCAPSWSCDPDRDRSLASEPRATYAGAGQPDGSSQPGDVSGLTALAATEESVAALAQTDLDALPDAALEELLRRVRRPIAQLVALRSRAAAASQARRLAAAPATPTGAAIREHQRKLAADQHLSPSEAKREIEAGRAARDHGATGAAFADGAIGPEQARTIARVLQAVAAHRRGPVEQELLELARALDPVAFGKRARAVLARETPAAAAKDERTQHLKRRVRTTDTPDGGFAFSGLLYGAAAEQARVAFDAFRKPDGPGEHRSPEQRTADAFEQLCAAALRVGEAPTAHGVRPHVIIVVDADQVAASRSGDGVAVGRFAWSGQPVTSQQFGSLLPDCDLTRVVLDAAGTPIEASEAVRTVPIGLWRSLVVRDGGCTWPGCDAPVSWCDVAHGHTAFAAAGRLSPDNAALLCRRHHRRFDQGQYRIRIEGNVVTYTAVDRDGPAPPSPAATQRGSPPTAPDRDAHTPSSPVPGEGEVGAWEPASHGTRARGARPVPRAGAEWGQSVLLGCDPP